MPPLLADVPHHVVRTPDMRTPDYPAKSSSESWNLWGGGHTDLLALHYHRAHPDHDRIWVVEYDIRFSGSWSRFFAAYDDDPTDLLAPGVIPRAQDPQWYNWPSFVGPGELEEGMQLRAFMPIYRASAALLREMDAAYRGGWGGHCEATWPSLARAAGLSVADLGGDGPFTPDRYRGRFYSNCPLDAHLAPGTLVFKPAMYRIGRRPDMLWHPVKPFFWRAEIKEGLRDMRRRAGIALRGLAAHAGIELPPALQPGAFEAASRRTAQPAAFRPTSDGPVLPKAEAS